MKKKKKAIKKKGWMPEYRKFCRELTSYLQYKMFLNLYQIDLEYLKEPKEKGKTFEEADDNCVAADIETSHRYYTAHVNIYPVTHKRWPDKRKVAEVIIHELCHVITDPMYKFAVDVVTNSNAKHLEDMREQSTQHIANIVMCALERENPKMLK